MEEKLFEFTLANHIYTFEKFYQIIHLNSYVTDKEILFSEESLFIISKFSSTRDFRNNKRFDDRSARIPSRGRRIFFLRLEQPFFEKAASNSALDFIR